MSVRTLSLLIGITLLCLGAGSVHAKRIALVIGNDNYLQVSRLEKAGNDADTMARELEAAGFEVKKYRDLSFKQTVVAFEGFFDKIKGGDAVAVFYAGHGVQTERGSYLLPTDIEGETTSQIEKISYSVNGLLEELDKLKPQFSLVIVDACRDNPLRSRGRTIGISRGLSAPDLAKGQMVIFSAGKNQKALDSLDEKDVNPNGVFTREFVARMRKPGLTVEGLAIEVKNSVERLARTVEHDQRPLIVNDSIGDFYFFAPNSAGASDTQNSAASGSAPTAQFEATREDQFWQDTKAPDNLEGYEAYLSVYPMGRYAGLARANISRLKMRGVLSQPNATAPPPVESAVVANARAESVQKDLTKATVPAPSPQTPAVSESETATDAEPMDSQATPSISLASYTLANGDKYEGEVMGEARTGQGKYRFANGDFYQGGLLDNVFSGKGVMTFASGERYEGDYVHGVKDGKGSYLFANKDRYEGGFSDNLFDGKGSFMYASGDRYDGDYVRGVKQGQGVYRFANGERYEGPFVANAFEGKGTYLHAGGDRYEGDYKRGVKQGQGIYRFANGSRYEGSFSNNAFNGPGKLFLPNGDRLEGTFRDGSLVGPATHFYANGDKYLGGFEGNVRHGKGVFHFANGQVMEMEFVRGEAKGQ
jgi:hypothetical protein